VLSARARHTSHVTRHSAFTLIELLVVIAIIAVFLVAVIPAVTSLSKSGGRKSAVSVLLGVLEQARTLAIKDGWPVYVVFPAGTPSSTDQNLISRYLYHSVAIFEDQEDPAKPGTFKQKQITEWKVLPTGVSIRSDISASPWATDIDFAFTPEGASKTEKFPYLKFNSSGQVESPAPTNGQIQLRVFEGYVSGGSEHITSSKNFDESIAVTTVSGRATYTSANQ
jgi:prepilin-type N-terminal cleavage/methylation domain-containing protein